MMKDLLSKMLITVLACLFIYGCVVSNKPDNYDITILRNGKISEILRINHDYTINIDNIPDTFRLVIIRKVKNDIKVVQALDHYTDVEGDVINRAVLLDKNSDALLMSLITDEKLEELLKEQIN